VPLLQRLGTDHNDLYCRTGSTGTKRITYLEEKATAVDLTLRDDERRRSPADGS